VVRPGKQFRNSTDEGPFVQAVFFKWKDQQAVLWARVKETTKRAKRKWHVGDLLADERCSPAVLDFLRSTYVGRAVPPVDENWDSGDEEEEAAEANEVEAEGGGGVCGIVTRGPRKSDSVVSFCFVLLCFVLFCFVLFCFVLFCFVLFCFVLFCFVLFCFVLFCFALFCFVLLCFVLFCFVLLCFVLFCIALFCFALFCFLV